MINNLDFNDIHWFSFAMYFQLKEATFIIRGIFVPLWFLPRYRESIAALSHQRH